MKNILVFLGVLMFLFVGCSVENEQNNASETDAAIQENDGQLEIKLETESEPIVVIIDEWSPTRIIIPIIDVDLEVQGSVDIYDPTYLDQGPVHFGDYSDQEGIPIKGDLPNTESGNVVIGGHRAKSWGHFTDLDLLEEGDEIYLDIEGYRFIYLVQWQKIAHRTDWSALETTDYPALTLMTCEPEDDPNPVYRLMVRAKLSEVTRIPESD